MSRRSSGGRSSVSGGGSRPRLFATKPSAPAPAARTTTTTHAPAAPATHAPAAPAAHTPAAPAPHAAPAAPAAPSMMPSMPSMPSAPAGGGFMRTIADGFMMGTGSALAHRAVDSFLGPRTVVHEHKDNAAPAAAPAAAAPAMEATSMIAPVSARDGQIEGCSLEKQEFERCMRSNNSNFDACRNILDVLTSCQQTYKSM